MMPVDVTGKWLLLGAAFPLPCQLLWAACGVGKAPSPAARGPPVLPAGALVGPIPVTASEPAPGAAPSLSPSL